MIQSFMLQIGRHPWTALIFTTILCAGLGLGLPKLEIDTSSERVFIDNDPDRVFYDEIREVFGDDVFATIMVQADDVFETDILHTIRDLSENGARIDGVTRVVSLYTVNNLKGRDGVLDTEPLVPEIPTNREGLERIRQDALENEILIGEVVSDSGKATAIHLFIESRPDEDGYEKRITRSIDDLVIAASKQLGPAVEIYHTGAPQVKVAILEKIEQDRRNLLPFQAVLLTFALLLFARCSSAVVLPLVTGALSLIATLGFMGWIGYPLTPVSVIIPSLIVVIGATEDIHLVFAYNAALNAGRSRINAIADMVRTCAKPITLTSLTTFIGFTTIALNPIPLVREFALSAAFGIAVNFLITILMVPTCIRFFGGKKSAQSGRSGGKWAAVTDFAMDAATRNRRVFALAALALVAVCALGISRIQVDTKYIQFFKADDPLRVDYQRMYDNLVGGANLLIVVDGETEGAFLDPENLEHLARLNAYLAEDHDKVLGYTNYIRRMHRALNDGKPQFYSIPDSSAHISQYNLLIPPQSLERFIDFDYSRAQILVRSHISGSREINDATAKIQEWAALHFPDNLKIRITGDNVMLAKSSERMSKDILVNLAWVLAAIVIVVGLLFRSISAGLISLVPNMLPVLSVFGLMGLLGIPLSTGTFPVAIIALGIAIDDTIHLMTRYAMESKSQPDTILAMRRTIRKEIGPVTTTSVALALGFLPLVFGNFATTSQFGLLTAAVMIVACFADLLVTPALLLTRKNRLKTTSENTDN